MVLKKKPKYRDSNLRFGYTLTNFSRIAWMQVRSEFGLQLGGFPHLLSWGLLLLCKSEINALSSEEVLVSNLSSEAESVKAQSEPETQRETKVNK